MSRNTTTQKLLHAVTGRPVEELLREMYLEKRLTQAEIAESLGVSRWTVINWLSAYGISRDDRETPPPVVAA